MKSLSLKSALALCASAAVLSVSSLAIAQTAPPPPGPRPHADRPGPGAERGAPRGAERGEHRRQAAAEHKKRLHDLLQITAAQEGAFEAWQTAVRPPERPMNRPDFKAREQMTTPQRIDAQLARLDKRSADAHARAEATKRFYGQLTQTQKVAFDALPPMMGRHGMHGGPGERGFGHRRFAKLDGHRGPGGPRGEGFGPPRDFGGQ